MPVELVVRGRGRLLAAALVAASACSSTARVPGSAERYPIRVREAYPAGTRYTLDVRSEKERRMHTERAGAPPEDRVERGTVHVRARVEVTERDEAHQRARFLVDVAEEDSYYQHPFLLRPGQVFVVVSRPNAYDARDDRGEALAPAMLRSFGVTEGRYATVREVTPRW